MDQYESWDDVYRKSTGKDLPWELGMPRPFLVDMMESGTLVPKGRAIDLCCGLGTNTMYLEESGFKVSGIDISGTAISKAMKSASSRGLSTDFRQGSVLDLPFGDGEFDFALDVGCFHHMKPGDRKAFLDGLDRVLKPGSRYLILAFSDRNGKAWNHFSEGDLEGFFSERFRILERRHVQSTEGTGMRLWFRMFLMEKRA